MFTVAVFSRFNINVIFIANNPLWANQIKLL